MKTVLKLFISSVCTLLLCLPLSAGNNAAYVDPFLGVDNKGNTFCGAALPFSMVKLGPDMLLPSRWLTSNSGYASERPVYGFSHTHVSGTGGGAKYGHFAVMPTTGSINRRDMSSTIINEQAAPGYYSGTLKGDDILCEMTLTPSVGFHRYTAPANDTLRLLIDVCSLLDKGSTPQHILDSGVEILSDTELSGYLRSEGGWNEGAPYTVYFYAVSDRSFAGYGTFRGSRLSAGNAKEWSLNANDHTTKAAYLSFAPVTDNNVTLKVAISYVSIVKAKQNFLREAVGVSFDRARAEALKCWNGYLDRVEIDASGDEKTKIYTGLYRSLLMPVCRTDEIGGWASGETYYDDYYAIWDTFRCMTPLVTLVAPEKTAEQIVSLINIGLHEGFMPDARSGNSSGLTQGGSNCDVMIADAMQKGINGIPYESALKLMLRNAENEPDHPKLYGRGGVVQYDTLGYVSNSFQRSGSRQVEYAACDYAVAVVAAGLGQTELAERYLRRSDRWKNLWNSEAESFGYNGFIVPRNIDGSWEADYDVLSMGIWTKAFYEGTSWQYSLYVPHNVSELIKACGGEERFVDRLDFFFDKGIVENDKSFYNVGNEPSFMTPMLYTWAARYDLTAATVRKILNTYFHTGREGLPGNDDSGAMSSWCAWNTIGLYPNAGSDYYLLTSPSINSAEFRLPGGKSFRMVVRNASQENIYIRSARLNGKPYRKAWLRHSDIVSGGELILTMDRRPSSFGMSELPPSRQIR